jgi:hypothetical protein
MGKIAKLLLCTIILLASENLIAFGQSDGRINVFEYKKESDNQDDGRSPSFPASCPVPGNLTGSDRIRAEHLFVYLEKEKKERFRSIVGQ